MTTSINLNPAFSQIALRKLAFYGSSYYGNDIYFLKEFVDLMLGTIGEEKIVELLKKDDSENKNRLNKIGNEWFEVRGMKKKLKKFDELIEKTKGLYDLLDDKKLEKNDNTYKKFMERASKVPLIKQDFYALFVFLVNISTIKNMNIGNQMFKILEHKDQKPLNDLNKRSIL